MPHKHMLLQPYVLVAHMQLPTTKLWLAIKDSKERDSAPFHPEMAGEVYEYYFRNYAVHFSSEGMSTAFATIPQVPSPPPPCHLPPPL